MRNDQGHVRRRVTGLATRTTCRWLLAAVVCCLVVVLDRVAAGQLPTSTVGKEIPRDVREMYDKGLHFLAATQAEEGDWPTGSESGPGVTGLGLMAFLASGEDPNFGVYSSNVRRALRSLIRNQDDSTGILGTSMYHHGFATLALAEAYGAVDDRALWEGTAPARKTVGAALELAVRAALTSQKKNPAGAWRYSPDATDADTSVSGAVLVGLLAARNAGIEVPDEAIDRAVAYFRSMTTASGQVGYAGHFGGFDESLARISIGALVTALAKRRDLPEHQATVDYLSLHLEQMGSGNEQYAEYTRYYQAQALFQGNVEVWEKWNKLLLRQLKAAQQPDGSFPSPFGPSVGTSMSLLAVALNYRFLPIYER